MVKQYVSRGHFEDLRAYNKCKADVCYVIENADGGLSFGWSNDGEGFFFYGSLAELKADWN